MNEVIDRLLAEIADLDDQLDKAHAALQAERFKDVPHRNRGDIVLVPRKLFGKTRWWPARINSVHLTYSAGTDSNGQEWVNRTVSYSVLLEQKDGTFGGSSEGYYDSQINSAPRSLPLGETRARAGKGTPSS